MTWLFLFVKVLKMRDVRSKKQEARSKKQDERCRLEVVGYRL